MHASHTLLVSILAAIERGIIVHCGGGGDWPRLAVPSFLLGGQVTGFLKMLLFPPPAPKNEAGPRKRLGLGFTFGYCCCRGVIHYQHQLSLGPWALTFQHHFFQVNDSIPGSGTARGQPL